MKTLFKNLIKTTFVASILFFGASFADAANFDTNPYGGSTYFTSINDCIGDCANQDDNLYINIPNPGDSKTFNVFLDFRNESSGTITNPTGKITYPTGERTESTAVFNGRLSGGGAFSVNDTTKISNLPNKWEIEFVSGRVQVKEHYDNGVSCTQQYGDLFNYDNSFSGGTSNVNIPNDLRYQYGNGWCDQGFIIATFEITNTDTEVNNNYSWYTGGFGGWGSCINNIETRTQTVYCQDQNSNPVSNSLCSGTMPNTSETRSCGVSNDVAVQTLNETIYSNSVEFLGEVTNDSTNYAYFVYGNSSISCNPNVGGGYEGGTPLFVGGNYSDGDVFYGNLTPLPNTGTYYYRACAGNGTGNAQGDLEQYIIEDNNNNNDRDPEAITKSARDVDEDSAELRGEIDMNDYNNGLVFFVYGQDKDQIDDVDQDDSYSNVDPDGDDLQKKRVDSNLNGQEDYEKTVRSLDRDERYYFRICVEYDYENNNETLECGSTKRFNTDDNRNDNSEIRTLNPDSISKTSARICGDLDDNGGDDRLRTWMEIRRSNSSSWTETDKIDRGEGRYCETVRNLKPDTRYYYRACSDDECASERNFITDDGNISNLPPRVTTSNAYNVRTNSAILPGIYLSNANKSTVWFQYGRSEILNRQTRSYTKFGSGGEYVHNFTGLKSNQRYCYRAMITTVNGSDYGATKCFDTLKDGVPPIDPPIIIIDPDPDPEIDLSLLGLGLSLVRLEIDDNRESVTRGQDVTYEISWENVSGLDLEDLDLNITIPREIQITSASRGILDQDRNAIFYTIDELNKGEEGRMTVTGTITNGNIGDALTAEVTIAFDNPVNDAQENATDYDVDEYVLVTALGTASIFGLANITFLGWLTILLGLLIVFLVARWLYLEREELRAQAYVNGYGTPYMAPVDNRYDYLPPAQNGARDPRYVEPATPEAPQYSVEQPNAPKEQEGYRPYRPNRG